MSEVLIANVRKLSHFSALAPNFTRDEPLSQKVMHDRPYILSWQLSEFSWRKSLGIIICCVMLSSINRPAGPMARRLTTISCYQEIAGSIPASVNDQHTSGCPFFLRSVSYESRLACAWRYCYGRVVSSSRSMNRKLFFSTRAEQTLSTVFIQFAHSSLFLSVIQCSSHSLYIKTARTMVFHGLKMSFRVLLWLRR